MSPIEPLPPLNSVVLSGIVAAEPVHRQLPSGSSVLSLQLSISHDGARADSVPVSIFDPPASLGALQVGQPVVVVGYVRRRFFRAEGRTQSRTDVCAERVVPARHRRRVAGAVRRHRESIDHFDPT